MQKQERRKLLKKILRSQGIVPCEKTQIAASQQNKKQKFTSSAPSLPIEIIQKVMTYLPLSEVCKFSTVCRQWRQAIASDIYCSPVCIAKHLNQITKQDEKLLQAFSNEAIIAGGKELALIQQQLDARIKHLEEKVFLEDCSQRYEALKSSTESLLKPVFTIPLPPSQAKTPGETKPLSEVHLLSATKKPPKITQYDELVHIDKRTLTFKVAETNQQLQLQVSFQQSGSEEVEVTATFKSLSAPKPALVYPYFDDVDREYTEDFCYFAKRERLHSRLMYLAFRILGFENYHFKVFVKRTVDKEARDLLPPWALDIYKSTSSDNPEKLPLFQVPPPEQQAISSTQEEGWLHIARKQTQ